MREAQTRNLQIPGSLASLAPLNDSAQAYPVEFPNVTCYIFFMATTRKKSKPQTPKQRMASRRERLRAQGLRPVQHWVPDLRNPKVLAEIRREIKLMAQHPENDAIDDWLDAIRDPKDWSLSAAMSFWSSYRAN